MLKRTELARLERELRRSKVLSVYVGNDPANPAERTAWRRALSDALEDARIRARGNSHADRDALEASVSAVERACARWPEALPTRGWAAFATPDGVRYDELLPSAPPLRVSWREGLEVGPYLVATDARLDALVAVVDSRHACVYDYREGGLTKIDTIRAHAAVGPVEHMGTPPARGFHTGTRGSTGSDAAQRELLAGRQHMLRQVAERLSDSERPRALILVGGIPEVAIATIAALPPQARDRAHRVAGLDIHARNAAIARAVENAGASIRDADDLARVDDVLARWAAAGPAVGGAAPIRDALENGAVSALYITAAFVAEQGMEAERLIASALDQSARIDVVHGEAARRLDTEASGLAAMLRFQPYRTPMSHEVDSVARA